MYPKVHKGLYFPSLLISQEEKYKDPYTSKVNLRYVREVYWYLPGGPYM